MLRGAREDQSLSREDAAHEINLRLDQLDALERDQFDRLPGDTFVRGYLRTYAKWLRLDVDKVLATYIEQTGQSVDVSLSSELNTRKQLNTRSDNGLMLGAALIVGALILGFWLYNANTDSVEELAVNEGEIAVDTFSGKPLDQTPAPANEGTNNSADTNSDTDTQAAQNNWENPFTAAAEYNASVSAEAEIADAEIAEAEGAEEAELETSTQPASESTGSVSTAQEAGAAAPIAAPVAASRSGNVTSSAGNILNRGSGPDELFFTFSEDCWLEVSNASGRKVFSAVRLAGQGLRIRGTAPFKVLVGNAPAVELAFNGEPVAVVSRNRRKSARLTLGGS